VLASDILAEVAASFYNLTLISEIMNFVILIVMWQLSSGVSGIVWCVGSLSQVFYLWAHLET
jgi:hypothetical protein